ncbi:UNVERIFIED_CONTAM: Early nodulin-like protein 1 [Sesamum angustifolium]|uniref:Early nodulin-like protein 1 n=1 Tax=Sesamum angustifolium TaxID=2727405 RepID=A0AAW2PQB5_9LAMI
MKSGDGSRRRTPTWRNECVAFYDYCLSCYVIFFLRHKPTPRQVTPVAGLFARWRGSLPLAASRTFTVGDVLVFNFTTGIHDAAEVSKTAYDSCNSSSPISILYQRPATITCHQLGAHFICTFNRHCDLGQNWPSMSLNSPPHHSRHSPQRLTRKPPHHSRATSSASATPAPSPRAAMTFTVGDSLGGLCLLVGPIAYQTWARANFIGWRILVRRKSTV